MTDNTQPEAMDLADWLEAVGGGPSAKRCAALLREQHARIAELESELEAVGAGGVNGPLVGSAAPPTAQAEGWMPIETAPKESGYLLLRGGREQDVASGYWLQTAYAGNGAWIWPFVHMTPRFWAHLPPTSAEGVEHG